MPAGLIGEMALAYRAPRAAMARQMRAGLSEGRALFHLMAACAMGAAASLPEASEAARILPAEARAGAVPAHLFGYAFLAPLLMYAVAALVHLAALAFGARSGFLAGRAAVFWALLLGGPLALVLAVAEAGGVGPWLRVAVVAASAYWLWLLAASLAEAERFEAMGKVAAILAGMSAAILAGFWLLARGTAAA